MKKKRKLSLLAAWAALALLSSGCGEDGSLSSSPSPAPSQTLAPMLTPTPVPTPDIPVQGGELTLASSLPKTFNPLYNTDPSVDEVLRLIYEPLAIAGEEQRPVPNPAITESLAFSLDGLRLVITLKNDKHWEDGSEITSRDVFYTLDQLKEVPKDSLYGSVMNYVAGYSVIDEYSVSVDFSEPSGGKACLFMFPILSEGYYKNAIPPDLPELLPPMGNSYYKLADYAPGKSIHLERNPMAAPGQAYIEKIKVILIQDEQDRLYAFDQNIVDVARAEISQWGKYRSSPDSRVNTFLSGNFDFIGFNNETGLFADYNMRKTAAFCVPLDEIAEKVYLSHGKKSFVPVSPSSYLYQPEIAAYEYNPDKAGSLLTAFHEGDASPKTEILVNRENPERMKIADMLRENMVKAGFVASVTPLPFEEYEERLANGDYEIFVGGYSLPFTPDLSFAFASENIGGSNLLRVNDPLMDQLLTAAKTAPTDAAYQEAMGSLQKHIGETLPLYGVFFRESGLLTQGKIKGEISPRANHIYNGIENWFLGGK